MAMKPTIYALAVCAFALAFAVPCWAKGEGTGLFVNGVLELERVSTDNVHLRIVGELTIQTCSESSCNNVDVPLNGTPLRLRPTRDYFFGMFHLAEGPWGGGAIQYGMSDFVRIVRANVDRGTDARIELVSSTVKFANGQIAVLDAAVFRITDPELQ